MSLKIKILSVSLAYKRCLYSFYCQCDLICFFYLLADSFIFPSEGNELDGSILVDDTQFLSENRAYFATSRAAHRDKNLNPSP